MIREQRASLEESLRVTVGHLVAHQWWGAAVGNDPAREPLLDEALACWSALLLLREAYGPKRAEAAMNDHCGRLFGCIALLVVRIWRPIIRRASIATHFNMRRLS